MERDWGWKQALVEALVGACGPYDAYHVEGGGTYSCLWERHFLMLVYFGARVAIVYLDDSGLGRAIFEPNDGALWTTGLPEMIEEALSDFWAWYWDFHLGHALDE